MRKNRQINLIIILSFWLVMPLSGIAQSVQKWGKVSEDDLQMTTYAPDPTCTAVVLQDVGSIVVKDLRDHWGVNFERHRRIKIFDPVNFDPGQLLIYFRSNQNLEKITGVDVQMFYPDGRRIKISEDNIFTEAINPNWSAKKIFLPNLQPGCIVEYRYELRSEDIVTLHDWNFQTEIPTRWSEVTVITPNLLEYANLINRPRDFDVQEVETTNVLASDGNRVPAKLQRFGFANLPALNEEPFMTTIEDYRANIGFQLSTINYTDRPIERYMTTWSNTAFQLENHERLGVQYRKHQRFDRLWKTFVDEVGPVSDRKLLPEIALRTVSKYLKWNGQYRIFTDASLDDAYDRQSGSSAELNLAMVALLQRAGIDAVPVLVSTRSHGSLRPQYPFYEQFNSIVAYVRQPGESGVLLDATDPYQPVNELRDEHYNGGGWQLDSRNPEWLVMLPPLIDENWLGNMALNEDGSMSGHFSLSVAGPIAADWRLELDHGTPDQVMRKRFGSHHTDLRFDSIEIEGEKMLDQSLHANVKCRVKGAADRVNSFIYCKPVLDFFMMENPFKTSERLFPVNFPYFHRANYVLNLDLPLGYRLEEVPEAVKFLLPRDGGKLIFSVTAVSERRVQLVLKMELSQLDFMPEDYGSLRQFFELMIDKTQTQLVLKKS
ncbi:MAG: DUF3857 domain-containing protein [Saprospiraceae bacterium]|nr:DUF3857 domain-containing protein [Saprospiraceae bacterium]